jgi:hypothetical protein
MPNAPRDTNSSGQPEPVKRFLQRLVESLEAGTFVRLVLSNPAQPDARVTRASARCIDLHGTQQFSITLHEARRDVTKNLPRDAARDWVAEQLGVFQSALLCTTRRDWQLVCPGRGPARLVSHAPTSKTPPSRAHDQPRQGLLDASAQDWLHSLDITDAEGRGRARMADKFRQINRYVEILTHLLEDAGFAAGSPLTLADMGSGKGYLTFAAWQLLRRTQSRPARVLGVEARHDLAEQTERLARGIRADGLEFVQGNIEHATLPRLDALVALHACDTATDLAILRGLETGARLIVVAPCCHKELRPQLGRPEPFAALLRHGLMEERLAEWATDGLRALFLEWAGFRTKVFEFVSSEHTAKNLMIAAVREAPPFQSEMARRRIVELKTFLGARRHALDSLLEGRTLPSFSQ